MTQISLGKTGDKNLRPIKPSDIYPKKTQRLMRTSVMLPSQQQSFAVCTESILNWFLSKFKEKYFNSVYVNGGHSFDEFRKLSTINDQLKRTNPLLALIPDIDPSYTREWIDSTPEIPMYMRRSRFEGVFLEDTRNNRGLYLQIIFKTIKMNFLFKIRLDTRAQQLDMMEYIKVKHRAGWSETLNLDVDIHVPKAIIKQIAFDNGFEFNENGDIKCPMLMLEYLNTHSIIPFLYKLRCTTGNDEYFIKVPNCVLHIKSELPTKDDGERVDSVSTNFNVEFGLETEMTAPYSYIYYSQKEQHQFLSSNIENFEYVSMLPGIITRVPTEDENHWQLLTTTEYSVDQEDVEKPLDIDFKELFYGTDIGRVLDYTQRIALSPTVFLNFIIINNAKWLDYKMDWGKMIAHIEEGIEMERTIIGIYVDKKYINDTIINVKELNKPNSDRV